MVPAGVDGRGQLEGGDGSGRIQRNGMGRVVDGDHWWKLVSLGWMAGGRYECLGRRLSILYISLSSLPFV